MNQRAVKYNVALAKGHGLQEESLTLLKIWQPGMSASTLVNLAVKEGILGRATEKRTRDIINTHFARRFLIDDAMPAKQLKLLIESGLSAVHLNQLFLIHMARANPIFHDFVSKVYWPSYEMGKVSLAKSDAMRFIERAHDDGKLNNPWADSIRNRISTGLLRSLADFGLTESGRKTERKILPFHINTITILYLIFDLHFAGFGDTSIIQHPDWKLFGLDEMDVVHDCQRHSGDYFILQYSGDIARFSWNPLSWEETFRAIAETEF